MRRIVLVVATWSLGTLLAMGLVWWAVGLVSSEVVSRPAAPISDSEVAAALAADPGAAVATTAVPAGSAGPDGATTTPADGTRPTTTASGTAAPTTVPRTTPGTGSGPSATPSTSTPATNAAPGPAQEPAAVTIDSVGGQVAVRYESGRVSLVWARPKAGFEAEVHDGGPETVEVRFDGDDHESRVRAFWTDGRPDREVREQDDGGDGDD